MEKRYVMGDIHGNARAMIGLLEYVDPDPEELVLLGDLINRGLDSWGVIEEAAMLVDEGATIIKGNHDMTLPAFMDTINLNPIDIKRTNPDLYPTYKSFKNAIRDKGQAVVQQAIETVYNAMIPYHEDEKYIFVHAGIDPRVPYMHQQKKDTLYMGCAEWKNPHNIHCYEQYVVYGHTPTYHLHRDITEEDARVWMSHKSKKIAIDTGAGFGCKLTMVDLYDGIAYAYDIVTREISEYRFKKGGGRIL